MPNSEEQCATTLTTTVDQVDRQNNGSGKTRRFSDLKSKLLYNVILVGILIAFGIFGAFVFKICEAASVEFGKKDASVLLSTREMLHEVLQEKTANCDANKDENWKNSAVEKLELFIKAKTEEELPLDTVQWGLADSWLFACTIFTTVGYGNIAPLSLKGRVFCMVFAAFGIPLFSVVAGSLASFITEVIYVCHAQYHMRKQQAKLAQQKKDDHQTELKMGEIPELELKLKHFFWICLGYLCLGALFFSVGEGWTIFESFYFCFITFTTVGLGDYVPGHVHHTILFGVYILVGIVLLIMFFGAMEEIFNKGCQKLKDKLNIVA